MSTALGLAAVLALIAANGLFVAAEFSFVAARRTRLEERAEAGDRRAQRALGVLRRLSFMLSGAQLGITATSLAVGVIAEPVFTAVLAPMLAPLQLSATTVSSIALAVGISLSTMAQMVFGELAPKNLAIARPEPVAQALAGPMAAFLSIGAPIIRLFDGSANALLRALGIEPAEELATGVSAEELTHIITSSGHRGQLTPSQTGLLGRAISFRTLRAGDAMVSRPHVVTVDVSATGEDLRRLAAESGHSRFPAVGDGLDDVRGIVQAKRLLNIPPARRATIPVGALLEPVLAVPETAPLTDLLADLRQAHTPLAVVVDEHGGTAGIVTLEDIVEELVGDIEDEYDLIGPSVQALADGSWRIPGAWRLDEVERDTGVALPPGEYETVGGLVMAGLGRVPVGGDVLEVEGATVVVEAMDGLAVGQVRLTATRDAAADGGRDGADDGEVGRP